MPRSSPASGDQGFTLLEILIAVVVLGLLVLGLSQGVRTGIALRQVQLQRLDRMAELDSTMRLLRTLLTRLPAMPEANRSAAAEDSPAFRGEPDRLTFVGNLPSGLGNARRADMKLFLRNSRLVLSWIPRRHEVPLAPRPPATDTELLSGVERLELAYWKPPTGDATTGWRTGWDEAELPELIRVRLFFGESDRRRWPDLVVAPRP